MNKYINLLFGKKKAGIIFSVLVWQLKQGQRLGEKSGRAHARKK
tara:strand:+ start:87 stop:218 length:132 start_codon:yes stop_codon:yes gene_type:complete